MISPWVLDSVSGDVNWRKPRHDHLQDVPSFFSTGHRSHPDRDRASPHQDHRAATNLMERSIEAPGLGGADQQVARRAQPNSRRLCRSNDRKLTLGEEPA